MKYRPVRPATCTPECKKTRHVPPQGQRNTAETVLSHLRFFEREVTPAEDRPLDSESDA